MSFAPGQFITAQRLNRLQSRTYWAQASGTTAASSSGVDVAGSSINLTIETDGATVSCSWTLAIYASASMATNASGRAFVGSDASPVYGIGEFKDASAKASCANFWSTTVATAGSYTAKLVVTTPANATMSNYTSLMVTVTEVA